MVAHPANRRDVSAFAQLSATPCFPALPDREGGDEQAGERVHPPPAEQAVPGPDDQHDRRQAGAMLGLGSARVPSRTASAEPATPDRPAAT